MMTLMKTARLIEEIGDYDKKTVTENDLLMAIESLNNQCNDSLVGLVECVTCVSASKAEVEYLGKKPYCEHPLKSMQGGGHMYKALLIPDDYPTIADDDSADLIHLLTTFYTFDACRPKSGGGLMKVWEDVMAHQEEWRHKFWSQL